MILTGMHLYGEPAMRHQLRPGIDRLESKTLLSHVAAALVVHHPVLQAEVQREVTHRPSVMRHEAHPAVSGGYVFSTLDDPNAGGTGVLPPGIPYGVQGTFLLGINNRGKISGNYGDTNDFTHGLELINGTWTTLNDPSVGPPTLTADPATNFFPGTDAVKMNNVGQLVGFYIDQYNVQHSFLLSHGHYTTIDPPGAAKIPGPTFVNADQAGDINDNGKIVGLYTDTNGNTHGYVLSNGHYTTLDDPSANGVFTTASGINDSGQIVGFYSNDVSFSNGTASDVHSFLLSHGRYTTLDDPNAGTGVMQGTFAEGINNAGQIVGYYVTAAGATHGFVLSHGHYTTLDDPAVPEGIIPAGINTNGQIVGFYVDTSGVAHGFLANPEHKR